MAMLGSMLVNIKNEARTKTKMLGIKLVIHGGKKKLINGPRSLLNMEDIAPFVFFKIFWMAVTLGI